MAIRLSDPGTSIVNTPRTINNVVEPVKSKIRLDGTASNNLGATSSGKTRLTDPRALAVMTPQSFTQAERASAVPVLEQREADINRQIRVDEAMKQQSFVDTPVDDQSGIYSVQPTTLSKDAFDIPAPTKEQVGQFVREIPRQLEGTATDMTTGLLNTARLINKPVEAVASGLQGLITGKKPTAPSVFEQKLTEGVEKSEQYREQFAIPEDIQGTGRQVLGAIGSIPQVVPALMGSPTAALGLIGTTSFGGGAREAEKAGATGFEQLTAGVGTALAEVASEYIPVTKLSKFTAGAGTIGDLAVDMLAEFVGEAATEAVSPAIEQIYNTNALNEAYVQNFEQTAKQIKDAGMTGLYAAVLLGGASMGVTTAVNKAINSPTPENVQKVAQEIADTTGDTTFLEQVNLQLQQDVQAAGIPQVGPPIEQRIEMQQPNTRIGAQLEAIPTSQPLTLKDKAENLLLEINKANRADGKVSGKLFSAIPEETRAYFGSKDISYKTIENSLNRIINDTPLNDKTRDVTEIVADYLNKQPDTLPALDIDYEALAAHVATLPAQQGTQIVKDVEAGNITVQDALDTKPQPIETVGAVPETVGQRGKPSVFDVQTEAAAIPDGTIGATMTLEELNNDSRQVKLEELDPIDTTTRVLTELPKRQPGDMGKFFERVYQEVFSTNVPFERIGGESKVKGSNLNRVAGTVEYNAVGKQIDSKGNEVGKSIVEIFSDVAEADKKSLFDYILNKHNIDRYKLEKPVFGETVNDATSEATITEYDQSNPEFAAKQQEITNYFKNLLNEWSVSSGLVSQETADMLNERYPNYVPTYRAKDYPKSFVQRNQNVANVIKKAKGGENFILPIDQQMIALTDRTIRNARRNELMNSVATAYEEGNAMAQRYIKSIKDSNVKSVDDFMDVGSQFDTEPVQKAGEYIVNFYTDGVAREMVVDKTLYKALETANADTAINDVAKVVKKYATEPFKALITGYNPVFAASNIMRDVPTALTYSSNPVNMSKEVPTAVKEMLTNGEKFKLFKALGGTREGLIGSGKTFKVPTLGESNKAFEAAKKANPVKVVGDINNFTETLPRFSEFLNVLEETGDPALAIYRSAELTTDFSRHGKLTKFLDNFVPYLNPSVQGIDKFARSMISEPLKTSAKALGVITVPTMILDWINKDDEEYNSLTPRERNLYFNIPFETNGEKKFIRVPKSRELAVAFSSIYEWAARAARGQEVTGKEIWQAVSENFTPADITSPIWTPAKKAWNQIKDPDAYETNYWGGLIVPSSQRRYSPGEQYDLNSSGIAKAIGQQFNISPFVVDYLLDSYGGIIGDVITPIGADRKTTPLAPLERKFINDPVFKSNTINLFYEALEVAQEEAQDYNKANDIPSKVVTPLEEKANALSSVSRDLSAIRKEQKALQVNKGTEDEVKELQKEMIKMAEEALKLANTN